MPERSPSFPGTSKPILSRNSLRNTANLFCPTYGLPIDVGLQSIHHISSGRIFFFKFMSINLATKRHAPGPKIAPRRRVVKLDENKEWDGSASSSKAR